MLQLKMLCVLCRRSENIVLLLGVRISFISNAQAVALTFTITLLEQLR
jgi:hypothetical protein